MSADGGASPPIVLRLDADPREPLAFSRGLHRALGRDPFAELGQPDPALALLEARAPAVGARRGPVLPSPELGRATQRPPTPRRRRPRPPPRLAQIARPGEEPPAWLGDVDPRRLVALEHLVDEGQRYDAFGLSPAALRSALPFFLSLYRYYFRVLSEGHEHLPLEGPAILAANHGGLLPFDGAMTVLDVLLHTDPPRLPRTLVDRFAGRLPFVNVFFARMGQVMASRPNFRELLHSDQLVLVFPEGVAGIRKPVTQRYQLQPFHLGFVEEALRKRVPIVPTAILGADDQAPILYDLRPLARRLRLPAFPITPTFPWLGPLGLLPYPVRYRIYYGPPLRFADRFGAEAADDPRLVKYLAGQVRREIQRMVDRHRS
jgi:1-acyl-sn-glycerol-3-phosphate acyltransferase